MALKKFDAEGLLDCDMGRIREAMNLEIKKVIADMLDRPFDTRPRKVNLTLTTVPVAEPVTKTLESFYLTVACGSKTPPLESQPQSIGVRHDGSMFFNDLSAANSNQRTIDMADGPNGIEEATPRKAR